MRETVLKVLLVVLALSGFSVNFKAGASKFANANLEFKLNDDLSAEIVSLSPLDDSASENIVEIPAEVSKDGLHYRVTSFSENCDIMYDTLQEIYLPYTFSESEKDISSLIRLNTACPNLEKISVDPDCKSLSSDSQGMLYNKDKTVLILCPAGKKDTVKVPKSVRYIYVHAFSKCKKIPRSIDIPLSVKFVGKILRAKDCEPALNSIDVEHTAGLPHKKIVIILLGESGAGKTTIAEYLKKYGYFNIPTYTTRPSRFKGEGGHIFVDIDSVDSIIPLADSETRKLVYITYFANNWYWAYEDQITDNDRSVISFNPTETKTFKEYVKDRKVVVLYLKTDRKECVLRMKKRALNGNLSDDELARDIDRRVCLEESEYSSFSCDYVIDASKGVTQTIVNLENCLDQAGLK